MSSKQLAHLASLYAQYSCSLHWYLAIIYHPHHTLSPPPYEEPKPSVSTRGRKRRSEEANADILIDTEPTLGDSSASIVTTVEAAVADQPTSPSSQNHEDEVEQLLTFDRSCSINDGESTSSVSSLNGHPAEQVRHIDDELDHGRANRLTGSPMIVPHDIEVDELQDEDSYQSRKRSPNTSEATTANTGFREENSEMEVDRDGDVDFRNPMDVDGDMIDLASIDDSVSKRLERKSSALALDDDDSLSDGGDKESHTNQGAVKVVNFYGAGQNARRNAQVSQASPDGPDEEQEPERENDNEDLPDSLDSSKIEDQYVVFATGTWILANFGFLKDIHFHSRLLRVSSSTSYQKSSPILDHGSKR
jgi:hypothetical protein